MIQVFTGFVNESKYKFEFTDYLCVLKEVAHVASLSGNSCWADSHGEAFKKISALLKYEESAFEDKAIKPLSLEERVDTQCWFYTIKITFCLWSKTI